MTERFGISLLHMPPECPLPQLNDVFGAVELSGALLNHSLPVGKLPGVFYFNGLMPSELTREIGMQSDRIKTHFLQQMAVLLDAAGQLGATGVVVDFGLESCFEEPQRRYETVTLIKRLAADLLRNNLYLLLPVRVPFLAEAKGTSEAYLGFLTELMCPNIGFAIDVHPHELAGRELNLVDMLHWIRFDVRLVHFIYEPETGNRLVNRLLQPWLEVGREFQWQLPYLVMPLMSRSETVENELVVLREFFLTFNTGV